MEGRIKNMGKCVEVEGGWDAHPKNKSVFPPGEYSVEYYDPKDCWVIRWYSKRPPYHSVIQEFFEDKNEADRRSEMLNFRLPV